MGEHLPGKQGLDSSNLFISTTAAPSRTRLRVMETLLESPRNGRSGKKKAVKSDTRRNDSGNRRIRTRRAPRSGVP